MRKKTRKVRGGRSMTTVEARILRAPPPTATEPEYAQPSPILNQPVVCERDLVALRPPYSQPPFCASAPKIHKLPEYNPSPKGHSGRSGGGLVPPWTCPMPIELSERALLDHRSLDNSAFSPREGRAGRAPRTPFSRYGGTDKKFSLELQRKTEV
jgi:hypothetical protein